MSWTSGSAKRTTQTTASSATSGSRETKSSTGRSATAFGGLRAGGAGRPTTAGGKNRESCLALVVVLDQFPRNMFRGDPRTYATDAKALESSKYAIRTRSRP